MPLVTINGPHLTREQKTELVQSIATTVGSVLDLPVESVITLIHEHDLDNIGSGDQLLSDRIPQ